MARKTPEEIVDERHSKSYQKPLEECTKSKEEKDRVAMHVAYYFYDCGIPFNTATARSFEVMIESVAQIGFRWRPPSYHDLRVKLLERANKETDLLLEKHKIAWKRYGCTLMSDGWTDRRNRHLINFLVNSPEGTFFLESVDASGESHDAAMLARLLEGQDWRNRKRKSGRLLEEKIPSLFWTPCAAHCLDIMLEDIGKLPEFKQKIESARRITTFIYRHGRIRSAMREFTSGKDLVRPGVTRFATSFLTLQSLYKQQKALKSLFVSDHWSTSKLANTQAGKKVYDSVFSTRFWTGVEDCIKASQPILVVLRIVDADEIPAMPEVAMAMEIAKKKLNEAFASQPRILSKLMDIVEGRWQDQMEVKLYGAALFLNPSHYFDLKENDLESACKQRACFNDVLEKMVPDQETQIKISDQVDEYDGLQGTFGKQLVIAQRKTKALRTYSI
ncbi:uncharacterized protein LOC115999514 [Ipomoea triloba]|uniref:uncharacterized protein LOC115999514 n=1 Tax=Ipomoea triloba TaxID=35885 RepID=UPI00125DBB65|nr:uncharacterized protein LOC115999514 [Ipomoea triloba]